MRPRVDTKAGAGKYLPALQDKEMEEVMKEHICRDKDRCGNGRCNYRTAHNTCAHPQEYKPFNCCFLGGTQHCEPVNKEGIMEDNRKGTWEDVTGECALHWHSYSLGGYAEVQHKGNTIAFLGTETRISDNRNYRVVNNGSTGASHTGYFKVEHFIPDPEPVIAYKAVRVENGHYRSVLIGSEACDEFYHLKGLDMLDYTIGGATRGAKKGIYCFVTLEDAKAAYVTGTTWQHADCPLAILEVEAIGVELERSAGEGPIGSVNYPSVKVLGVAWEEEKKEEWVDVTKECTASLYRSANDTHSCVQVCHDGIDILWLGGDKPHVFSEPKYRVTLSTDGPLAAGEFKVEKRND